MAIVYAPFLLQHATEPEYTFLVFVSDVSEKVHTFTSSACMLGVKLLCFSGCFSATMVYTCNSYIPSAREVF